MEQFSLEKYLENPSRKVVTRRGNTVRIICFDRKHGEDNLPVVFLEESPDGIGEFLLSCRADGTCDNYDTPYDLFFADEKEELTEFEKCVQNILNEPHFQDIEAVKQFSKTLLDLARKEIEKDIEEGTVEFAKSYMEDVNPSFEKVQESEELWKWKMSCLRGINKAYKQGKQDALKDFPKWKKMPNGIQGNGDFNPTYLVRVSNGYHFTTPCLSWDKDSMYIELSELEKLPKEE